MCIPATETCSWRHSACSGESRLRCPSSTTLNWGTEGDSAWLLRGAFQGIASWWVLRGVEGAHSCTKHKIICSAVGISWFVSCLYSVTRSSAQGTPRSARIFCMTFVPHRSMCSVVLLSVKAACLYSSARSPAQGRIRPIRIMRMTCACPTKLRLDAAVRSQAQGQPRSVITKYVSQIEQIKSKWSRVTQCSIK